MAFLCLLQMNETHHFGFILKVFRNVCRFFYIWMIEIRERGVTICKLFLLPLIYVALQLMQFFCSLRSFFQSKDIQQQFIWSIASRCTQRPSGYGATQYSLYGIKRPELIPSLTSKFHFLRLLRLRYCLREIIPKI